MKFVFIVQGEGRGHMTQAISLYQILQREGHKVSHVIVGKSRRRKLPPFFKKNIPVKITQVPSPNFITDRKNKSVKIWATLVVNLSKGTIFLNSIRKIHKIIKRDQPDAVINFYDFIGGFYFMFRRPKVKHIVLAHQFLLNHTTFEFPKARLYDKFSMLFANYLASFRAEKILALSFQEFPDEPHKRIHVVPPLLRNEIGKQEVIQGEHFLVYMVNDGYSVQVEEFHKKHPEIPIHCFWDKKKMPKEYVVDETLTFHQLDDKKFIEFMSSCKAYLSTAGFESICEAMYMGKPVLMVPVKGQYEQTCNAIDAKRAGAGVHAKTFDLEILFEYLPHHVDKSKDFKKWCGQTSKLFIEKLTSS